MINWTRFLYLYIDSYNLKKKTKKYLWIAIIKLTNVDEKRPIWDFDLIGTR